MNENIEFVETGEKVSEQIGQNMLSEKEKQDEYLKPFVCGICKTIENRIYGLPAEVEIEKYIQELSLKKVIDNINKVLPYLKSETSIGVAEDNCNIVEDLLENIFYLFTVTILERKKQEKIAEEEMEIRHELEDLENAKQIFGMLKNEILKYVDNFDEFAISIYVNQMLEYARKHKLDLGMEETKTYS